MMNDRRWFLPHLVTLLLILAVMPRTLSAEEAMVRVYVLAGQSNMEGKAKNQLLEHQAAAPETKELFDHLRQDGKWIVRDDVFIKFLDRKGRLTIGYGSPDRTGAELEFGTVMGDRHDEPILLIKTAWGGRSLYRDFRPPSAGMPSEGKLLAELEAKCKSTINNNEKHNRNEPLPTLQDIKEPYGASYRDLIQEVKRTCDDCGQLFPELQGKKLRLAGFVWFQGWNDQYNGAELEYASNLKCLIQDVRKDLDAPQLPVVIGVMGQNGSRPSQGAMLAIQEAQQAMEKLPQFRDNVKAVRTDVLVDKTAEELYPDWRENFEQWEKTGSDFGYHYMGSAIWFNRIGRAMAQAMLELEQ